MILDAVVADAIASIMLRPLTVQHPQANHAANSRCRGFYLSSNGRIAPFAYFDVFDRIGWKCVAYLSIRIEGLKIDQMCCSRYVFKAMLGMCIDLEIHSKGKQENP